MYGPKKGRIDSHDFKKEDWSTSPLKEQWTFHFLTYGDGKKLNEQTHYILKRQHIVSEI